MIKAAKYLFLAFAVLLVSCAGSKVGLPADDHSAPINGKKSKARRPPPSMWHGGKGSTNPF
jgi:hypothetical protein